MADLPLPISISIISHNEEANLPRCLASAAELAREIVIVDSGSTDRTLAIAEEFGAKVHHQDFLGHRDQKNLCLDHCSEEWILALDCDEELTPELRASILRFFDSGDHERYVAAWMPRLVWFMGRWIHHGDWYPDKKIRLFKRSAGRWQGHLSSQVHERVVVEGPETTLQGDLLHYSFRDIRHYLDKHVAYSDTFLEQQQADGVSWTLRDTLFRPWWRFFRAYVLRRGFLDGFPGFWIAMATGFFAFIRHSRKYEAQLKNTSPTPPPAS